MQFSFGGDSGMTYEEMLQARKFAETARGTFQRPQNVGEGWGSIFANVGAGLVGRAADKAEAAGREEASEQFGRETSVFGDLLANRLGGGPTVSSMGGGQAPQAVRNTAMASNGGPTTGAADAMRIRQGLIERGLPEHVADGFVMNFEDESGLNPGINERNPLVEGSRGGFGLAQWTGPRRRALEQYAQQRGASVADADVQMDFLMTELQGPESRAAQSILSSKDAGQAGAAIVNDFLRPAEEHRARRVAEYTGGGGYSGGQGGGVSPGLMEAMSNPYMTDAQRSVLGMLFQQQMAASAPPDPMQALQMERAQLEIEQMRNPQADPTSAQQNYQYMIDQGIDQGTAMERAFGKGGTNVSVSVPGQSPMAGLAKLNPGETYAYNPDGTVKTDENGVPVVTVFPGSEAAIERGNADKQQAARESAALTASDIVTTAAQQARAAVEKQDFGSTGTTTVGNLPWTDSAEVVRQNDVLKSQAAIGNLNAMRQQSPTGGALGNVTEGELKLLQDQSGSLDPNSPTYLRDLDNYERTLLRTIHGREAGDRIFEQTRPPEPTPEAPAAAGIPPVPQGMNGVTAENWPEVWERMPPEDQDLFR